MCHQQQKDKERKADVEKKTEWSWVNKYTRRNKK